MASSITVHLQIFKRPQLLRFSTHLDETGIKNHGLLRSIVENIVATRVAVPFKLVFFDFSLTVKAAPHECLIRTGQP